MRKECRQVRCPPREEWDFRGIPDEQIPDATLWEYARTSDAVRLATEKWLNTQVCGKSIRDHFTKEQKRTSSDRTEDRLQIMFVDAPGVPHLLQSHIRDFLEGPRFPAPWVSLGVPDETGRSHWPVQLIPIADVLMRRRHAIELLGETTGDYLLQIDWSAASVNDIVAAVADRIREEARKHAGPRTVGKRAQVPIEPLKWLAAFRFKAAGFTFDQAQAFLECYLDPSNPMNRRLAANRGITDIPTCNITMQSRPNRTILPLYSEKSGWSDAVRNANARLRSLEKDGWREGVG
jgi:hypothetical protein